MKKLLVFIILLLTVPAFAGEITGGSLSGMTISKSATPAPEEPTSDCSLGGVLGYTSVAANSNLTADTIYCLALDYTLACVDSESCTDGVFVTGNAYEAGTTAGRVGKLLVYKKTAAAPNANDTLVAHCAMEKAGTSAANEVCTMTHVGAEPATCSGEYWICFVTTAWALGRSGTITGGAMGKAIAGSYANPPANLGGYTTPSTANVKWAISAEVGDAP